MRHKTIELVVSVLCVLAMTVALIVAPATGGDYMPGSEWQAFSWSYPPCGQFVNEGPFTFFVQPGCSAVLHVTDAARTAERLEVYDNGQYTGLTTSIPHVCGCDFSCPYTEDFDQAFTTNDWSSGSMDLAPGSHSVNFRAFTCCTNSIGAFRVIYQDCNCNGTDDAQDIANGTSQDCNRNGLPDECDIAFLTSQDCNVNLVPDECDIADGTSQDINNNGIPDDCDCLADLSGGGVVDAFDLAILLGAWCSAVNDPNPPSPPCENCFPENLAFADLTGPTNVPDGCVDAFDLAKLLAAWGRCQ